MGYSALFWLFISSCWVWGMYIFPIYKMCVSDGLGISRY